MGLFVLAVGFGGEFRCKQSGFIGEIFAQEKPHLPRTAQEWVSKERRVCMGLQGTCSVELLCVSWTDAEKETVGTPWVAQGSSESKMSLLCSCPSLQGSVWASLLLLCLLGEGRRGS